MHLPLHRFLNLMWAWCLKRVEPEKIEEWTYQMKAPLPGRETMLTEAQAEDEGEAFMAMMQMTGGG